MDGYAAVDRDEAEDLVAIYGMAALGQLVVNPLEVSVDDQDVVVALCQFLVRVFIGEQFGAGRRPGRVGHILLLIVHLGVLLYDEVGVELSVCNILVEL